MSEDEKKEIEKILLSNAFNAYNMEVLRHFATQNYAWKRDIKFLLPDFVTFCPKIYITKYLKQLTLFIIQNV